MAFSGGGGGIGPGLGPVNLPRGQGGGNRDSYKLPNEGLSQAEYEEQLEHEAQDEALGRRPSFVERFKRWFSGRF